MVNQEQTLMRFLEMCIFEAKKHGPKDLAFCASPQTVQALKNFFETATGKKPVKPLNLFGLPVYEFEELPPEKFLICDRSYALRCLNNRIPFCED